MRIGNQSHILIFVHADITKITFIFIIVNIIGTAFTTAGLFFFHNDFRPSCKFFYFLSGEVGQNRKDLCGDSDVAEMITCIYELESKNLYVVRADDFYLDDVFIGEREEEEESESE